jgi:hypothetical protein
MLTATARQKKTEMEMVVAPPGSETASFEVGEVQLAEDGSAFVSSTWTDVDQEGKPHHDQIVWILRNGQDGWRIKGMATKLFEGKLILDFEDPEDMQRKLQLAEQEMLRRAQQQIPAAGEQPAIQQAQQPQNGQTLR